MNHWAFNGFVDSELVIDYSNGSLVLSLLGSYCTSVYELQGLDWGGKLGSDWL